MKKRPLSSVPKSRSKTGAGASSSPTAAGTSSSDAAAGNGAKPSVAQAEEPKSSPRQTQTGLKGTRYDLPLERFLQVLSSTLSLAPKAGVIVSSVNYQSDCVMLKLTTPQGLRLCKGKDGHAHIVDFGWFDNSENSSGLCFTCSQ